MGQIQSLDELLNFLFRRRWIILAVALIGATLSAVYAKSRPDTYETAAVIQVQSAAVQGADTQRSSAAAVTLQMIEQRLTTRENLAAVINRHAIYADLPLSMDKKIDMLRSAISFQGVDSAAGQNFGEARAISAILVFARMDDPELAARVANDFAQGILDQSAAGQRARADQNVLFFQQKASRIGDAIAEVEAEAAAYKSDNAENLPEARDARRDEVVGLETDLRRLIQERLALEGETARINAKPSLQETDRRALDDIAARLQVLAAQISASEARKAQLENDLTTSAEVERVLAGFERQLDQLRNQYDAAMGGGNRKLAIAGAFASLLAGLAVAFALDLLFPVVRTAAQMERQLDLRPVVTIPEVKRPRGQTGGAGVVKLLDDPAKPMLGLPRYVVFAAAATLMLLTVAAIV